MEFTGKARPFGQAAINDIVNMLAISEAALWTVVEVETSGVGFLPSRQPAILFERHKFSRKTGGKFDHDYPDISNATGGGYGSDGAHQYTRLAAAIELDRDAALESASWGLGQVMGEHWEALGYASVEAFVAEMCESEGHQMNAVALFLQNNNLTAKLLAKDWAGFARGYNGPNYAANAYDKKLAQHYQQLFAGPAKDLRTRAMQLALTYLSVTEPSLNPNGVDGLIGRRTRSALSEFQSQAGLPVTGKPDDATYEALMTAAGLDQP